MALRNYSEALRTVRSDIGKCDITKDIVDSRVIKEAEKAFAIAFPKVEKLRHAVAHPEYYTEPRKVMSTGEPIILADLAADCPITVQGSFVEDVFLSTINGLVVQWSVNAQTCLTVIGITRTVFDEFAGISWS